MGSEVGLESSLLAHFSSQILNLKKNDRAKVNLAFNVLNSWTVFEILLSFLFKKRYGALCFLGNWVKLMSSRRRLC